jgi:hypothetical protein
MSTIPELTAMLGQMPVLEQRIFAGWALWRMKTDAEERYGMANFTLEVNSTIMAWPIARDRSVSRNTTRHRDRFIRHLAAHRDLPVSNVHVEIFSIRARIAMPDRRFVGRQNADTRIIAIIRSRLSIRCQGNNRKETDG